jgi:hypothetical protein
MVRPRERLPQLLIVQDEDLREHKLRRSNLRLLRQLIVCWRRNERPNEVGPVLLLIEMQKGIACAPAIPFCETGGQSRARSRRLHPPPPPCGYPRENHLVMDIDILNPKDRSEAWIDDRPAYQVWCDAMDAAGLDMPSRQVTVESNNLIHHYGENAIDLLSNASLRWDS